MVIVGEIEIWNLPIYIVQGEDSYLIPIDNLELVKFGDFDTQLNRILRLSSRHVTSPSSVEPPTIQPNSNVVPFQQLLSNQNVAASPTIALVVQQQP